MIYAFEEPKEKVSYGLFRRWCREAGIGKFKRRRASRARLRRERMANRGFMLQLDGSEHRWNGKDIWTKISIIDDADSKVLFSRFFKSETTFGCMYVLRRVIEDYGVPEFILTDRAGWSLGSAKRQNFSQFIRACESLGIRVIAANSAEGKVELSASIARCKIALFLNSNFTV